MKILYKILAVGLFLSLSACGIVKKQNYFLTNLRIPNNKEILTLTEDTDFTQIRGKIKTEYYAFAGKGDYELVFESDSGLYYYAYNTIFVCEDNEIGGLFITKENEPHVYLWTSLVANERKFTQMIANPEYVERLKNFTNVKRPFIHWYYEIESDKYEKQ